MTRIYIYIYSRIYTHTCICVTSIDKRAKFMVSRQSVTCRGCVYIHNNYMPTYVWECMYEYICIHDTYIQIYTYTRIYMHTYKYTYIHIHTCPHIYVGMYVCLYMYIGKYVSGPIRNKWNSLFFCNLIPVQVIYVICIDVCNFFVCWYSCAYS